MQETCPERVRPEFPKYPFQIMLSGDQTDVGGVSYNCGGKLVRVQPQTVPGLKNLSCPAPLSDCGSEVLLRPGDIVICRECGYRILYKKRTKQSKFSLQNTFHERSSTTAHLT